MFLRILKKDLVKRKATNLIVLLFVILASMFVGAGLNNVLTVANGTDYFLKKARIGDFVVVTMKNTDKWDELEKMLKTEPSVKDYRLDTVIYTSQDGLKKMDGSEIETKNITMVQCLQDTDFLFFNEDDEAPAPLLPGHCYVSGSFLSKNNLHPGDSIRISQGDVELTVILDGKVKDALFGSDFMGNTRFLLHEEDFKKFSENKEIWSKFAGQVCCIDTIDHDTSGLEDAMTNINVAFAKPSSTISLCYVMDMIVAFVVLILSVCLIVLAFVVLKVSLSFTITKEFREIGVLKAIGIKNIKIRTLFLIKYLVIALIGSAIGFFLGIPLSRFLLKSVSENMVLGNSMGILLNLIGAVIVVIAIILMAFFSTKKVKKATPVDAIRTGQTGERYNKKSKLHLANQHSGTSAFLAKNDTISNPKRYIAIIIAFCICTLFVLMLVNTTNTMKSDSLISTFCAKADLYINNLTDSMEVMGKDMENMDRFFAEKEQKLAELGMPGKMSADMQYTYGVTANGKTTKVVCEQGYKTDYDSYVFLEGTRPENRNEIAVTSMLCDKLGVGIGDKVTIDFGSEQLDCLITANYQSFNQIGEIIRLHPDAPTDNKYSSSLMAFQITFDDHPSDKVILERKAILEKELKGYDIFTTSGYVADCIGVVGTMEAVQYLLLAITLIIVSLVTILMELSFIADEKSQIALLKAIGFKNGKIYKWHVIRFGIVAAVACILAGILSIPMTELCISPIFGLMGVHKISYAYTPLQIFLLYPGIILLLTLIVAFFTSLSSKSIHSYDTANIE
ncbi:MAG: ABC transporter permease [Clostridiales bacterium]|nr:ABC transporter permease [Clostridiales bacterium]